MDPEAVTEDSQTQLGTARLTVLSEPPEREIEMTCVIEHQAGQTMRLRVAQSIPLDTALSIEGSGSLWLGQANGCSEQENGFLIEVHLYHHLRHLPELARMAERFRGFPDGRRGSDRGGVS